MDKDNQENIKIDEKQEEVLRFPCSSCGGNMVFNPDTQGLECPYCSNRVDISKDNNEIKEHDFSEADRSANKNWGEEKRVIKCQSCGAQTVLNENSTAQFCPFCGSSYIVKLEESAGIAPESLIPFKISRQMAMDGFKNWIGKRFFAPNDLKKEYKDQKLTGMYIPFWTYDTDTYSTYTAEAGTYYYVTVTEWVEENGERKMRTRQERRIRWWPTSGDYSHFFDDVLVNASKQMEGGLITALEPYDLLELTQYKPEFLSGFLAERYSVNLSEGFEIAKDDIKYDIRSGIERKINADEVRNLVVKTSYSNIKYKHLLLPVWLSAYTYKNKVYRYMVNGQTGEVQGKAPVSAIKVALLILLITSLIGAGIFALSQKEASSQFISLLALNTYWL